MDNCLSGRKVDVMTKEFDVTYVERRVSKSPKGRVGKR